MSKDWCHDIAMMHEHYKVHPVVDTFEEDKMRELLQFRIRFLEEEMNELKTAESPDDVVDALVDLCVVAIGTMDIMGVDPYKAWDEVLKANMKKKVGVKESRPNPLGLPDLIKPAGWVGPTHEDNTGRLTL
jgi:predicted HAD superfamily Cof-like phosphohydrolase